MCFVYIFIYIYIYITCSDSDSGSESGSGSGSGSDEGESGSEEEESDDESPSKSADDDLLGLGVASPSPVAAAPSPVSPSPSYPPLVRGDDGVELYGKLGRKSNCICLILQVANKTGTPISGLNIQFNRSSFGIKPQAVSNPLNVAPGGFGECSIPLTYDKSMRLTGAEPNLVLEAAIQNANTKAQYRFKFTANFDGLFSESGKVPDGDFIEAWKRFGSEPTKMVAATLSNLKIFQLDEVISRLQAHNIHFITKRDIDGGQQNLCFFSAVTDQGMTLYVEVRLKKGFNAAHVTVKWDHQLPAKWMGGAIKALLS